MEENVFRFNVTMDYVIVMHIFHSMAHLFDNVFNLDLTEAS